MKRLLVDCGHTLAGHHYTGIQRYVRRTVREAVALRGPEVVAGIAASRAGGWSPVAELAPHPMEGLPAVRLARQERVQFDAQSVVLLADRFWHTEAWDALDELLASRAQLAAVVYDLLSLREPQWFPPGVGERFGRYLRRVLPRVQHLVCLTQHVVHDVAAWAAHEGLRLPALSVVAPGHVVWGGEPSAPATLPSAWRSGATRFVLQVGTLEPRKNHRLTLGAMRSLWASGEQACLLVIGQPGWLTTDLAEQLQAHCASGRIVWLPQCSDAELAWCYRHAAAVVYPSAAEGYGLPLAEAAAAGAQVVATGTPVHKEVVAPLQDAAASVQLCAPDSDAIVRALRTALARTQHRSPGRVRSWRDATQELLEAIER